jgi:hypothetical protein
MKHFINRKKELATLREQYSSSESSFMVIYGRRRVGKTTLIKKFIEDKNALYFLATQETQTASMKRFAESLADYTGQEYLKSAAFDDWRALFEVFAKHESAQKKVLVIDELPFMVGTNAAFPSILQWVWDTWLKDANVMLILCGSLIHMMEKYTLNYSSPLYGRRTGQIKLKQIDWQHYYKFCDNLPYRDLVELYAVTGGVPRYIELFDGGRRDLFKEIERLILDRDSYLYEEPEFLLQHEVEEIGSYFSIIKSIAAGNHRAGKICTDIGIKQTSLPKYLKTLTDMDILEREVPITESNPEKSKMGMYQIKDNFLRFWFRFVFPERTRLEIGQSAHVLEKIKANFVDNHAAFIYENVCRSELWQLNDIEIKGGKINFNKLGRWWNKSEEIDIVALDSTGDDIVFAECKFTKSATDTDVFYELKRKSELVPWNRENRNEIFVLFSVSGFTPQLKEIARERGDVVLFERKDRVFPQELSVNWTRQIGNTGQYD